MIWSQPVANASTPLVVGGRVYVGGSGSTIYSFDSATGLTPDTALLGDPTTAASRVVGSPTFDTQFNWILAGTDAGDIYGVLRIF